MKQTILIALFLVYSLLSTAQGEANNWVFGGNAGISWNSGVPVPFTGSVMNQSEGCCSMSDTAGNLLFYSDGVSVWNRNHQQMPNGSGLMGHFSTTQSAVAVPWPGNSGKYFLFTVTNNGGANGFRYSVVDMNLQAGLGNVVAATKNTLLYTPSCEKITVTRHVNGTDFWVATHQWNTNAFYTYLVTSAGVNAVPVVSTIGSVHSGNTGNTLGYMKFSPNGKKIGVAVWNTSFVEMFQFNDSTGEVGNLLLVDSNYDNNGQGAYGLEFSTNSNVLYVAECLPTGLVYQYDLQAANIVGSKFVAGDLGSMGGALQLGPDKKIYGVSNGSIWLSAINAPDVPGAGCGFQNAAITLTNAACGLGLPNFIQSYFAPYSDFTFQNTCDSTAFSVTRIGADSIRWNFGDNASGTANVSTLLTPYHLFSSSGTFSVTLTAWKGGAVDSTVKQVIIQPLPVVTVSAADSFFCSGDSTQVCAAAASVSYLWNTNDTGSCIYANHAGNYYVTVTDANNCTAVSNHLAVNVYPIPPVSISVHSDTLHAFNAVTYQWYLNDTIINGATDSIYVVNQIGNYTVAITDTNGCRVTSNAVNVVVSGITSFNNQQLTISIHPNPATSQLFIETNGEEIKQVNIYNTLGEVVIAVQQIINHQLSIINLPSGVYIAEIKTKDASVKKRWVKE